MFPDILVLLSSTTHSTYNPENRQEYDSQYNEQEPQRTNEY